MENPMSLPREKRTISAVPAGPKVAIQSYNSVSGKWEIAYDGQVFHSFAKKGWGKRTFANSTKLAHEGVTELAVVGDNKVDEKGNDEPKQSSFSIDERFEFVSEMVRMVRNGVTPSMIVSGPGGLGKSFTILEELEGLEEIQGSGQEGDYLVIKGFSTPKALFRTLQTSNDKLIIFDDCDSVLKDLTSQNLLKSALDSFNTRRISWNAESNDDLERSFDFTGRIIFISNMTYNKIPQSLVSRSYTIDLNMTTEDKLKRMETILPRLLSSQLDMPEKLDALEFVKEHVEDIVDLNFRTLIKVAKIRKGAKGDWKKMAEYMTVDQA